MQKTVAKSDNKAHYIKKRIMKFLLSFLLFCFISNVAHADWCKKQSGGVEPCASHPSSWSDCGILNGETIYCYPSGTVSGKSHGSGDKVSQKVLISVGVGLAVVVIGYWVFHKKPSQNNPGHVSLMEF